MQLPSILYHSEEEQQVVGGGDDEQHPALTVRMYIGKASG